MGYMNFPDLDPQETDEENNASDPKILEEKTKNDLKKTLNDDGENEPQYIEPISFFEKD